MKTSHQNSFSDEQGLITGPMPTLTVLPHEHLPSSAFQSSSVFLR